MSNDYQSKIDELHTSHSYIKTKNRNLENKEQKIIEIPIRLMMNAVTPQSSHIIIELINW